jgi:uncharacterized protein (DUF2336 family)
VEKPRGTDAVWEQVKNASLDDLQEVIRSLDLDGRLTDDLIVDIGERGGAGFFELAIALRAALPVERVRSMMSMRRPTEFVQLIRMARVDNLYGPRFLRVAKQYFSTAHADAKAARQDLPAGIADPAVTPSACAG